MPTGTRNLLKLWDYGWLDCHALQVPPSNSPEEMVMAYLHSEDFGTSFVGPEPDVFPNLHGPFKRDEILASDFREISPNQLKVELESIQNIADFGPSPSAAQWDPVESLLKRLSDTHTWTVMLHLTERDRAKFHDWGHVLYLFREFLFASPGSVTMTRAIFGYD